jgi:hypothetical protein
MLEDERLVQANRARRTALVLLAELPGRVAS